MASLLELGQEVMGLKSLPHVLLLPIIIEHHPFLLLIRSAHESKPNIIDLVLFQQTLDRNKHGYVISSFQSKFCGLSIFGPDYRPQYFHSAGLVGGYSNVTLPTAMQPFPFLTLSQGWVLSMLQRTPDSGVLDVIGVG
eukprot:1158110-Pelagomonas_calceolata.AAC.10